MLRIINTKTGLYKDISLDNLSLKDFSKIISFYATLKYYNYKNMSTSGQLTACLQPPSPTGSLCLHQCLPLAARRSSAPLSWPGKARRAGGPVIEATGKRISCLSEKIEVKAPKIIFDVSVQIQLN